MSNTKIVLCVSGFSSDVWNIHNWMSKYKETGSDLDVILLYDYMSYEIMSYWGDRKKIEVKEMLQIGNFRSGDEYLFDEIRKTFLKMSAYRYVGKCIVVNTSCIPLKKITDSSIPVCKWAAIPQQEKKTGVDKEWQNIIYQKFSECSFIERIHDGVMIFNSDHYDTFNELFQKYKNDFFDVYYYPFYHLAILSLCHKICNGTLISHDWAWPFNIPNKTAIFKEYFGKEGSQKLLEESINIPNVLVS